MGKAGRRTDESPRAGVWSKELRGRTERVCEAREEGCAAFEAYHVVFWSDLEGRGEGGGGEGCEAGCWMQKKRKKSLASNK
jgi:hypothetical protein